MVYDIEQIKQFYKYDAGQLKERLKLIIEQQTKHKYYDKNRKYAQKCYRYVTGDMQEEIVAELKGDVESESQKEHRKKVYNSVTQLAVGRVMAQFRAINNPDAVHAYVKSKEEANENPAQEVEERRQFFSEGKSLDEYLTEHFVDHQFLDPNQFYVAELINDDPKEKKPYVYPVEIKSSQAIDYPRENGVLQYLVAEFEISVKKDEQTNYKGSKYFLFGPVVTYVAKQIDSVPSKDEKQEIGEGELLRVIVGDNEEKLFWLTTHEHRSPIVPAIQIGYLKDPRNNHNTYASPIFAAEKTLDELIAIKSEYDLIRDVHGFAQKFIFGEDCNFIDPVSHESCNGTGTVGGRRCPDCKGSGMVVHKSQQDVVLFRKPASNDDYVPLKDLSHYQEIPDRIIDRYKEDLDNAEIKVSEAVFNKDTFTKNDIKDTATAVNFDKEAINNILWQMWEAKRDVWVFFMTMIAIHTENDKSIELVYKGQKDFRLETLTELLELREKANKANAPAEEIQQIDVKIMNKFGVEDEHLKKMIVKSKFLPFGSKSPAERLTAINSLDFNDRYFIAWRHHDEIFDEIFNENDKFLAMDYDKQKEVYNKKVLEFSSRFNG